MKIENYIIVSARDAQELASQVRDQIDSDWQPYGSPFCVNTDRRVEFFQAMIKPKKE